MRADVLYLEEQIDRLEVRLRKIRTECLHERFEVALGCIEDTKIPVRKCVECGEVLGRASQQESEDFWASVDFNTSVAFPG